MWRPRVNRLDPKPTAGSGILSFFFFVQGGVRPSCWERRMQLAIQPLAPRPANETRDGGPTCDHLPPHFSLWEEPRRAPALRAASRKRAGLCHLPSRPIRVTGPREHLQRGVLSANCDAATLRGGWMPCLWEVGCAVAGGVVARGRPYRLGSRRGRGG